MLTRRNLLRLLGASVINHSAGLSLPDTRKKIVGSISEPLREKEGLSYLVDEEILRFISGGSINKRAIVNGGFLPYAFSNISEGLYNLSLKKPYISKEVLPLMENIIQLYFTISPYGKSILKTNDLGDQGIYLSNLNSILGHFKRLGGSDQYSKLNERISVHLTEGSMKDDTKQFPPYPNIKSRWVAEQTFTLYTLRLFDENYKTNFSKKLKDPWIKHIEINATDKKTNLPITDIKRIKEKNRVPRGSALSYLIKYMAYINKNKAKQIWRNYKKHFKRDYIICAGFREFPRGIAYREDVDSGPILNGIGSSATVFGIGSANALGDNLTAYQLKNLLTLGRIYLTMDDDHVKKRISEDIIAKAVEFNVENTPEV